MSSSQSNQRRKQGSKTPKNRGRSDFDGAPMDEASMMEDRPASAKSSGNAAGKSSQKGSSKRQGRGNGSGNSSFPPMSSANIRRSNSDDHSVISMTDTVLETIPQEYVFNPTNAEPILYYLPKAFALSASTAAMVQPSSTSSSSTTSNIKFTNLRLLLAAAEDDIRLHRARIQAGKTGDTKLLRKYKIETDTEWLARQQRLNERVLLLSKLDTERQIILKELLQADFTGLTAKEKTQVQLARWQRALELFVYAPPVSSGDAAASIFVADGLQDGFNINSNMDLLGLLEKLFEGISEEDEMSDILAQASGMCSTLVDVTKQVVRDASESIKEVEDSYQIRLEAHEMFARNALERTEEIQNQFRINGRAALQIGNQLEFAESKRQRCESASILIRRWWLMESLAEQEALSGEELKVQEEVRGVIPLTSCRMDPLFLRPENSLEAARALKQLRSVVRSRGNAASANLSSGQWEKSDTTSSRRFDLTANLINRTSDALEQRLLNKFSEIYAKGGNYDFSSKSRSGSIDWRQLRELSRALLLFDTGRNLHKRYVEIVVSTRFPELFDAESVKPTDDEDEKEEEEFDMDATRSKLSNLFHRVSEVCMKEFQLIAFVFGSESQSKSFAESGVVTEDMPLVVARALCTRVIGDPNHGLQARINGLLENIDKQGDFDTGAKKLDTFVVIHEKAAGLFGLLKDAADRLLKRDERGSDQDPSASEKKAAATRAVESLKAFLNSQELSLNNSHRQGYLNLELRLLHHECCNSLAQVGCMLLRPAPVKVDQSMLEKGILQEYKAPLLPLDKSILKEGGYNEILAGPLKQSVLRQPLIHATDSLARARLMFGSDKRGGETIARVIASIYNQMCTFYGQAFLFPIVESLSEMLPIRAPHQAPQLPFDEDQTAHDMGVDPAFWVALERVHSAAKAFDREMWAEGRSASNRVWEILTTNRDGSGISNSMSVARECRVEFFTDLETRGESCILKALDTLSTHIQWILVTGGEAMSASGGTRILQSLTGTSGGPYAMAGGSSLEAPNSPAVKSLTYCLRVQFVHVQAALTPQSLSAFWTALSMRLYDILVARLLQHYYISTVGAVILARDVEALRSVSMLAGTQHEHWDILRELLTLYMTPPDALKIILIGPEGDASSGKGLFQRAGKDHSLVFLSRRVDYRYRSAQGQRKSSWALQLLESLGARDPSDGHVNIGLFSAAHIAENRT